MAKMAEPGFDHDRHAAHLFVEMLDGQIVKLVANI